MPKSDKPSSPAKLLLINQVFGPLACQLANDLARKGVDCTALTGWVEDFGETPGFRIAKAHPLRKSPLLKRLISWSIFAIHAWWKMLFTRADCLIVTNPPIVQLLMPLIKRLSGRRYALLIYDIYPDVAERMGMLRPGGFIARMWRRMSRKSMLKAEAVITLGEHMADTLRSHLKPDDDVPITVIPNWADTDVIRPMDKHHNPFAAKHGLVDKLVVTYSGAFGATHDIESIIGAAQQLQDLTDVHFLLIGGGTQKAHIEKLVQESRLSNLSLLDFQPFDQLPYSLSASDCCIVCLDENFEGMSVPSKTYYAMSAGAAVIAVCRPETELADMIRELGCGTLVSPGDPDRLAEAVRQYASNRAILKEHGEKARKAAESLFSRRCMVDAYMKVLNYAFVWYDS